MLTLAWFYPVFEGFVLGVIAMVLHECGHMAAARAVGVRVKDFGVSWKGAYLVRETGTPAENLLISLAGPLTNALLMLCWPLSQTFFLVNLCCAFCNLLPIRESDGDRALTCWRQMRAGNHQRPATTRRSNPEA